MNIYQEEYKQKIARENNLLNTSAYIQGFYNVFAVAAANDTRNKYLKEPVPFFDGETSSDLKDQGRNEKQAVAEMQAWASALGNRGLKQSKMK